MPFEKKNKISASGNMWITMAEIATQLTCKIILKFMMGS